jgi:dolichol-phosphate mannosyltransferase
MITRVANTDLNDLGKIHLAVVIPAYQVEKKLQHVLDGIPKFIRTIIVVDDCSRDGTLEIAKKNKPKRIHVLHLRKNHGVGGAMLYGMSLALELGADIVIKMDGDGQMDPDFLPALLQPILEGRADYAKGNRFMHSTSLQKMPSSRRVGNIGLTFMTKMASGYWNIFDPVNGFFAIHRTALGVLDASEIDEGYFFESSMLVALRLARAVVCDVAIPARYGDEPSSMSLAKVAMEFPVKLFRMYMKRLYHQYFLHDMNAGSLLMVFSVPLLLFGLIWGIAKWIESAVTGVVASTGTVLLAVLPIILGVQFLTQALIFDTNSVPTSPLLKESNVQLAFHREQPLIQGFLENHPDDFDLIS